MSKKVREFKAGDYIFAKVKGYPAWPARIQHQNGKKYFVLFYGTGETANLPPNMIFDYVENKDQFLKKTVKRKDFNEGVRQIEHDFINKVPIDQVIGAQIIAQLKSRQTKTTPVKPTPKASPRMPKLLKTPRSVIRKNKAAIKKEKAEEFISRSGRKIRPKRHADEEAEKTPLSPAALKRRSAPLPSIVKAITKNNPEQKYKQYNTVTQAFLENIKEPFKIENPDRETLLLTYLPEGYYVGVKVFDSRPNNFKSKLARLKWDTQAANNALILKAQLERGQISPDSVLSSLETGLRLTPTEKAIFDRERIIEEKKIRVQFLKTEMKLIELDAKVKTCLCLEKADTETCLVLLDEYLELDIRPLMLLKHPTCLETVKRMRAYVGNTPSWDLSEDAALLFNKQAHKIRRQADLLYKKMKGLFSLPERLSFWEFFSERVLYFKKVTSHLNADELLEMIHLPFEMTLPTAHTMQSAIDATFDGYTSFDDDTSLDEDDKLAFEQKLQLLRELKVEPPPLIQPKIEIKKEGNATEQNKSSNEMPGHSATVKKEETNEDKDNKKDIKKIIKKEAEDDEPVKESKSSAKKDIKKKGKTGDVVAETSSVPIVHIKKEPESQESADEEIPVFASGSKIAAENIKVEKRVKLIYDDEPKAKRPREMKKTESPPKRQISKRKSNGKLKRMD